MTVWHISFLTCDICGEKLLVNISGLPGKGVWVNEARRQAIHNHDWRIYEGKYHCQSCAQAKRRARTLKDTP